MGGLDVLSKMEATETDKKERPKVSIKIEDTLVFVDPYAEIDEQVWTWEIILKPCWQVIYSFLLDQEWETQFGGREGKEAEWRRKV